MSTVPVAQFDPEHPAIQAQWIVNAAIGNENTAFGVYNRLPQPTARVLADIRAIAGRALTYGSTEEIGKVVPDDLLTVQREATARDDRRRSRGVAHTDAKPGLAAPARSATAAVGVVAALNVLESQDVEAAGRALSWLVAASRKRGSCVTPTHMGWGRGISPVLVGVQLAALRTDLNPWDQLRYRIGSELPSLPMDKGKRRAASIYRRIPTMLWSDVSQRFSVTSDEDVDLRVALSVLLCVVNSRIALDDAIGLLSCPIKGREVSAELRVLESSEHWPNICIAIIRLADYLAQHEIPIDYRRRRGLGYSNLLPDDVWQAMCGESSTPPTSSATVRIVRCFLYEKLSSLPARPEQFGLGPNNFRYRVGDFGRYLSPGLESLLDEYAQAFLADHGLAHEPITWSPPISIFDGLDLPDFGARAIDTNEPQPGGAHQSGSSSQAAVVQPSVPPAHTPSHPDLTNRGVGQAYRIAEESLAPERLKDLYERQRLSLREIGDLVGVGRNTITALARAYKIPLRDPKPLARTAVEREWLYEQYVNHRRTLRDIATELGMSPTNLARWAKELDIPVRPRGGISPNEALAFEATATDAPALLRPALLRVGGRKRLERFVAAVQYETLGVAAERLGVDPAVLTTQINRVERDIGTKLLVRAARGRPMRLTDVGVRTVAAFRTFQGGGGCPMG